MRNFSRRMLNAIITAVATLAILATPFWPEFRREVRRLVRPVIEVIAEVVSDDEVYAAIKSVPPHYAGISRPQQNATAGNSTTLSAPNKGDLIVVLAYRDTSNTPATVATGYTTIDASTGAGTNSARLGYKWSDGTETSSGTWTNATHVSASVYRGAHFVGAFIRNSGTASTTITYAALTLQDLGSRSWLVGFGMNKTSAVATAPSGMTLTGTNTSKLVTSDTNAVRSTNWTSTNVTGNGNGVWITYVLEVRDQAAQTTGASIPKVVAWRQTCPGAGQSAGSQYFQIPLTRPGGTTSANTYTLGFAIQTGATVTITSVKDSAGNNLTQQLLNTSFTGGSGNTYGIYDTTTAGLTYVRITVSALPPGGCIAWVAEQINAGVVDGTPTVAEPASGSAKQPGSITVGANSSVLLFATDVGSSFWNLGATGSNGQIAPGDGATLLGADSLHGTMCQWQIASAGAINPIFYPIPDDGFAVMAIAYKASASTGTEPTGIRVFGWQDWDASGFSPGITTTFKALFPCQGDLVAIAWNGVSSVTGQSVSLTLTDSRGNNWTSRTAEEWGAPGIVTDEQFVDTDAATLKASQGMILSGTIANTQSGSCASFIDIIGSGSPGCFGGVTNQTATGADFTPTGNTVTGFVPSSANCLVIYNSDQADGNTQTVTGTANWISYSPYESTMAGGVFGNDFMNNRGVGWGVPPTTATVTFTMTEEATHLNNQWGASVASYNAPAGFPGEEEDGFRYSPIVYW